MKILVTNHHLYQYTGTEVSTLTLSKYLKKRGHSVILYSKYLASELVSSLEEHGIKVTDDLSSLNNEKFDIAHVQHNICAYEVRHYFPDLPMVMWIHGKLPFLEQVPALDLNISYYLTINQNIYDFVLKQGINKNKLIIFRNLVDSEKFYPIKDISQAIKNVLVISNKLSNEKQKIIKNVFEKLNLKAVYIGLAFNNMKPNNQLINYINNADVVFTIGLGAMETMFCGRIPILFDENFTFFNDGIITTANFDILKEHNFSGRALERKMSINDILHDLKKYNYLEGVLLRKKALENYEANQQIDKIIEIYRNAIKKFKPVKFSELNNKIINQIVQSVQETKDYTTNILHIKIINPQIQEIESIKEKYNLLEKNFAKNELLHNEISHIKDNILELHINLNKIKSSKFFKIWQKYNKIKKYLNA